MKNCSGFTLAEVLITLGVIGVVAAMTIPTVIKKYQEQVTVNKFKKAYSTISRAYMFALNEHGDVDTWNFERGWTSTNARKFVNYLKPYIKILKDCGVDKCKEYTSEVKYLNGDNLLNFDSDNRFYKLILGDGTYTWFAVCHKNTSCYAELYIDTNGSKAPNTVGKDIFYFHIDKNSIKAVSNDCDLNSKGKSCSGYILEKGNMDYLHSN